MITASNPKERAFLSRLHKSLKNKNSSSPPPFFSKNLHFQGGIKIPPVSSVPAPRLLCVVFAALLVGLSLPAPTAAQVCDRTPQVRDALVAAAPVDACEDVTDSHLAELTELDLGEKGLTALQSGDFAGLTNLRRLYLTNNKLKELPADLFAGLTNLRRLWLDRNHLRKLPADLFAGLTNLRRLWLDRNHLRKLPADVFSHVPNLLLLHLDRNKLKELPEGVFDGLTNVGILRLNRNALTALPADVFTDLNSLETLQLNRNPLTCLPAIPSSVAELTLPAGTTREDYSACGGVCDRTSQVRDALVEAAPVDACEDVTNSHLAELFDLQLGGKGLTALQSGDFAGLTNLIWLYLDNNSLGTLPADVFDGLTNLMTLELSNNSLATLPADVFDGLTNLGNLELSNNSLATLPADVFDGLNLWELYLDNNSLGTLPADVFDGLPLTVLDLDNNSLGTLPADVFDGLNDLGILRLKNNDLTCLPAIPNGVFVLDIDKDREDYPACSDSPSSKAVGTLPTAFALQHNVPNPFNPATTIRYALPQAAHVTLTVYNIAGQAVRTLVAEHQHAGRYVVGWDATDDSGQRVSSGIYFYRLQAGEAFAAVKKMLLVK